MSKPLIRIEHTVRLNEGGPIALYGYIHSPFMQLMASLYPKFAGYAKAEKGYSAFVNGEFVGCFAGLTLQSVRKNPFFDDKEKWFMRSLLAGLAADGYGHHSSVCGPENYGTLRLWQKLGLGAKLDARGKARSADLDDATDRTLRDLIAKARPHYPEVRRYAETRLNDSFREFLPVEHKLREMDDIAFVTADVRLG